MKLLAQWQEITRTCTVCGNALELVEHMMSTCFYCICWHVCLLGVTFINVSVISWRKCPVQSVIISLSFGKQIPIREYYQREEWDWTEDKKTSLYRSIDHMLIILVCSVFALQLKFVIAGYLKPIQTGVTVSQIQILGKQWCFDHGMNVLGPRTTGLPWLCTCLQFSIVSVCVVPLNWF